MTLDKTLSIFLILVGGSLFGQNQLTLKDAVKLSLQNNFDIQISSINAQQAKVNNTWGQAGALPTVSLNASQNNNITDQSKNPTAFIQEL